MSVAYVDTSCLVAVAFGEKGAAVMVRRLQRSQELVSSNLLEAELRATFARQAVAFEASLMSGLRWILPHRPLAQEMERALSVGHLRGADLWHVACALYVVTTPSEIAFLTLDERQRTIASALGFAS